MERGTCNYIVIGEWKSENGNVLSPKPARSGSAASQSGPPTSDHSAWTSAPFVMFENICEIAQHSCVCHLQRNLWTRKSLFALRTASYVRLGNCLTKRDNWTFCWLVFVQIKRLSHTFTTAAHQTWLVGVWANTTSIEFAFTSAVALISAHSCWHRHVWLHRSFTQYLLVIPKCLDEWQTIEIKLKHSL